MQTAVLAARNLLRQRMRTGMTVAAVAVGVAALILSGGFVRDMFAQLADALIRSQLGHVQIAKAGFFTYGSRKPEDYVMQRPEPIAERARSQGGVVDVLGRRTFPGLLATGRREVAVIGEGVEPDKEARLGTRMALAAGRQLQDRDRFGMLIGLGVAQALKVEPGSQVSLLVSTPGGAMNTLEFEVVGVFKSFSKDYDARAVKIPLEVAQELLDSRGVNVVVVSLGRTRDTAAVAARLQELVRAEGLEVKRWDELNDFYPKTVALYDRQFGVLRLIILIMVLLSVGNTVGMTVFERIGEFGTMRALGHKGPGVFFLILVENAILGAVGASAGVFLGLVLAAAISAIGIPMPPPPNSNVGYLARIRVELVVIGSAFVIGFLATTLASLLPAARAVRVSVVDALRQNV
jgi:putative ABC transport system permease protein